MIRIRARRVAFAALATALAVPASARSQDALPSAEDVIDRYVESIGGRDRVLSREGSRSTGTFSMPAAGIEGTVEVITGSSPTRVLSRFEIPGLGTILNGYTGEVGWSMDPNLGPRLLEGKELAAVVEGSSRHASVRDASLFDARETVEETEMNGESCYKVRLLWKSGRETFDCYSKESGLLVASIATQESPMGEIEGVTLMSEYRDFDGILTPTRMTQRAMGQEQLFTLDSVEYTAIDPAEFEPPKAIQTLIEQQGADGGP